MEKSRIYASVANRSHPERREAALVFGQVRLGCVFEGCIVQKRAGSRMNDLLLGVIDYPCLVEAVGLYGHQSRGRGVFNRKN